MQASGETNNRSNRRWTLQTGLLIVAALMVLAAFVWARRSQPSALGGDETQNTSAASIPDQEDSIPLAQIAKTDAEWKSQLTQEQFEVTRHKATERPFTGEYWNNKQAGTYKCVCCGAELFKSDTKYDSGCGWPSFWAASKPANVHTADDRSLGMVRAEVTCQHCGAHLGHLFDDGPQPTGQRYCMNSAALRFEKQPEEK